MADTVYDVIIIGAGITGSFIAHDLSKCECSVLVLDKAADVADGATMANSAIIHAGYDPKPGTLKALLNVRGNRMYPGICKEIGEEYLACSAFVVATSPEESRILDTLADNAADRDIEYRDISGDEARDAEPNLSKDVIRALEFPTTGIVYPWNVAIALMEEAVLNGVTLKLNEEVTSIETQVCPNTEKDNTDKGVKGDLYRVKTQKGTYTGRIIINAAGVYADKIYSMALGHEADFTITPRRGEYYVLDEMEHPVVSRIIYPVPGPAGKGVLVVPTIHNNILIGPNSQVSDDKEAVCTSTEALTQVKAAAGKTVSNIPYDKVIRTFAGLRPSGGDGDFIIEESGELAGFVNVACIDSPGLASAPAISEYVLDKILGNMLPLKEKQEYIHRKPFIRMYALSDEEKNEVIKADPAFGEIVCRCTLASKGEILDAIRRPVGATTVKGVKKRVGPGLGRCQGGFCEPNVVEILAEELGIDRTEVRYDSEASVILMEEKGVRS